MPTRRSTALAVHPINVVTRRTGLSADVIRAWEKRHGAVAPKRSDGGRRLYSDVDVERLRLLSQATLGGRAIGQVAGLSDAALSALVDAEKPARVAGDAAPARDAAHAASPPAEDAARGLLDEALAAVARYDAVRLDLLLRRATVALSAAALLDLLVVPLTERLEHAVRDGTLRPAQQYLASVVLRRVLDHVIATATSPLAGPSLVVATPAGQPQELGALVTAAAAALEGWRVTYLGPGLPAEDVAETVAAVAAPAVMLSLSATPGGRTIPGELRRLRALLPSDVTILVEGASTDAHRTVLGEIGAAVPRDLDALRLELRTLSARSAARRPTRPSLERT